MKTLTLVSTAALALAFGVLISACGTTQGSCDPSNCSGCCDADGECQMGVSNDACGVTGLQCKTCNVGELCQAGVCFSLGNDTDAGHEDPVEKCLSTCSGCCDETGKCQSGIAQDSCGRGTMCTACSGGQNCNSGRCVDPACATCVDAMTGACVAGGGTTEASCGRNGTTCKTCAAGETCTNGFCITPSCIGCITSTGECMPGNSKIYCGGGNQVCAACGVNQACQNGACADLQEPDAGNCKSNGAACGTGAECCSTSCNSGVCGPVDTCNPLGTACEISADCCPGTKCSSAVCVSCKNTGACVSGAECCSNSCVEGTCAAPAP